MHFTADSVSQVENEIIFYNKIIFHILVGCIERQRQSRVSLMQLYLHRLYDFITFNEFLFNIHIFQRAIFSLSSFIPFHFESCLWHLVSTGSELFACIWRSSLIARHLFKSLILHNYSSLSYLLFKWFLHLAGWLQNCRFICAAHRNFYNFTCFGTWCARQPPIEREPM